MKKFFSAALALVVAALAVSCTVNETVTDNDIPEGYKVLSISASNGQPDSKTSYAGEKTFSWSVGDKISLICNNGSENQWVTFTATSAAATSSFTAVVPNDIEMGPLGGSKKVAMFPASDDHIYNSTSSLYYNIPAVRDQRASSGGHRSADIPMFAWGDENDNYSFANISGAVKFTFINVPCSAVKFTFTAGVKMNGTFHLYYDNDSDASLVHWSAANTDNASEKTVTFYGDVEDGNVSFYIPYAEGSIWGYTTATLEDASTDAILYSNNHINTLPVNKNRVTVLPALNLGFESAYGIDWKGVTASTNTNATYPALKSLRATADDDYLYLLIEADPDNITKTHLYGHYLKIYCQKDGGSESGLWGDAGYNKLGKSSWAVYDGNIAFMNWTPAFSSSNLLAGLYTWYYEVRIPREYDSVLSGGTVNIGVVLDDTYTDDGSNYDHFNGNVPCGILPEYGSSMYQVELPLSTAINLTFEESDEEIANPERGLYKHVEYQFLGGLPSAVNLSYYPQNLVLTLFYLKDYVEYDHLPADAVTRIGEILGKVRDAGKKAIVRFAYQQEYQDANKVELHPHEATPERILNHIEDVAQVLDDNQDVIYLVQAGWIGTYGEWYYRESAFNFTVAGSAVTGYDNQKAVLDKILATVPENIQVGLRTAFYKRYYLYPESIFTWEPITSWGTEPNQRLSFFNDGFRGSPSDIGTFNCQEDIDMWYSQGNWLACGGELSYRSEETFNSLPDSLKNADKGIAAMRRQHFSYLHDSETNRFQSLWTSQNRLEDIKKALGYRLVLNSADFSMSGLGEGGAVNYTLKLTNTGCAPVLYARPFKLVRIRGGVAVELEDLGDIRDISPAAGEVTISGSFTIPSGGFASDDKIAIWLPDNAENLRDTESYSIRLANSDVTWNGGYNVIYTF